MFDPGIRDQLDVEQARSNSSVFSTAWGYVPGRESLGTAWSYVPGRESLGRAWNHMPNIPGVGTVRAVMQTSQKVQEVIADPTEFATQVAKGTGLGIMAALQVPPQAPGEPTAEDEDTVSLAPAALSSRLSQILMGGVSAGSSFVMKQLLENSETYDLDQEDVNLQAEAIKTLTKNQNVQKSLPETAKSVWNTLNKYHILIGGINLNIKNSSDEKMRDERVKSEGPNLDGYSPIHSLMQCQESWRTLRTNHALNLVNPSPTIPSSNSRRTRVLQTAEEKAQIEALVTKTDTLVSNFSQKTVHYATMYIIHRICNHSFDPAIYQQILQEGGNIEEAYLKKFDGPVRRILYKAAFRTIAWFIRPLIGKTIEEVITHLRKFLNSDVDLLQLVQKKMGDMADYYGRIEKARCDYTQPNRNDECGTFDNFLKHTIQAYGQQKLTEEELMKIFGDYIVDNFVPRPQIKFFGYKIPLISSFFEWIGHSIRKAVVRHAMNKAGIVKKMLTQGTDSVHYAQLGLKRLLAQKLDQVLKMVQRSRSRPVVVMDPLVAQPVQPTSLDLEAKKTQLISRQLHLIIQQHSSKLLRFIDIESCNGDERKLADLDNRVSALVSEIMSTASNVYKGEPFSIGKVLEDASTHAMETALLALFEDKEKQIEENLQTIFDVLDKSYTYVPENERADSERQFLEECAQVDQNLSSLQDQLSRAAVAAALESHLKNVSGEKHNNIKSYVQNEKELYANFVQELTQLGNQFNIADTTQSSSSPLKASVSRAISLIEQYLSHISAQLPSPELEACYSDVRGDLHNIYASAIVHLNKLHEKMNQIAIAMNTINKTEGEIVDTNTCEKALHNFSLERPFQETIDTCKAIQTQLPPSIQEELKQKLEAVIGDRDTLENTIAELTTFDLRAKVNKTLGGLKEKQALFAQAKNELDSLKLESREYHDLQGTNSTYLTQEAVDLRKADLLETIQKRSNWLNQIQDVDFKRDISPHLAIKITNQLYTIFYPSFFATKVPIFSNLSALQAGVQQWIEKKETELAELPETPSIRKEIEDKEVKLSDQILKSIKAIQERLQQNRIAQQMQGDELKILITQIQKEAFEGESFTSLSQLTEHFTVKGCISVGEIKLHNRLAPEITAHIAPKIIKGTRTMIDAMGKPFHYKQLVLRLLFLDIADRRATDQE